MRIPVHDLQITVINADTGEIIRAQPHRPATLPNHRPISTISATRTTPCPRPRGAGVPQVPGLSLGGLQRSPMPISGHGQMIRLSDHPHQPGNTGHLVTVICSPALNIATSPNLFVGQSASGSANSAPRSDKYG